MCFCQSSADKWSCGAPACDAALAEIKQQFYHPWHPMSDPVDVKYLGKLAEECGELGSAVARCLIQGIDDCEPDTGKPNRTWLAEEIADVIANIALCSERFNLDRALINARAELKKKRLKTWYEQA